MFGPKSQQLLSQTLSTTANDWIHVAVVFQDRTPSLYVNGRLVATGTASTQPVPLDIETLGAGPAGAFAGRLDDVRTYDHALSAAAISTLYAAEVDLSDTNCAVGRERSTVTLSCPAGSVIATIDFASYGTPSGSCNDFKLSPSCHSPVTRTKLQQLCLGWGNSLILVTPSSAPPISTKCPPSQEKQRVRWPSPMPTSTIPAAAR